MHCIQATDAKRRFGDVVDQALGGPVAIARHGRTVAVVVAAEEYRRLAAHARWRVAASAFLVHQDLRPLNILATRDSEIAALLSERKGAPTA